MERALARESSEKVMSSCGFKFLVAAKFAAAHTPPPPQRQYGREHVKKRPFCRFRRNEALECGAAKIYLVPCAFDLVPRSERVIH
jgi:hypothetical protein